MSTSGIDWSAVPATEDEARALGCTCTWIFKGAINHFDDDCPILDRHNRAQIVPESEPPPTKLIRVDRETVKTLMELPKDLFDVGIRKRDDGTTEIVARHRK